MLKFEIRSDQLTDTIEALRSYQMRLETDAAALASLPGSVPRRLAEQRAEEAEMVKQLFYFFLQL